MKDNKNYTNINVKYLREKKGISQTKLAKELNIDTSTLAKWENNTRQITLEWAIKLANYFDMNVGDFISVNQITNTSYPTQNNAEYKKILKEKGLMDDKENINDESLNKLLKIADMIDGINKKEN
jgi:transcriptional regulator with XRE-family HTH domain